MTLYDEYRKAHPIAAEPSEFRDIIEAEVRRALEWMRGRDKPPLPDSVSDWAEADFKRANDLMAPLFDKIVEYESLHYPIDEPSREEAEAFRREQEEGLPAEDIEPGRYMMITEVIVENCCHAGIGCGMKCRGLVYGLTDASVNRCLESVVNGGATFQAVGGGARMKIAPDRLYLDINSPFREVVYRRLKDDNAEYLRADLALSERHQRLVEAAKGALELMLTGATCLMRRDCKYYTECIRPDGECTFVLRLQAALAAVEG